MRYRPQSCPLSSLSHRLALSDCSAAAAVLVPHWCRQVLPCICSHIQPATRISQNTQVRCYVQRKPAIPSPVAFSAVPTDRNLAGKMKRRTARQMPLG
jgi:hypothetical protein